MTPTELNVVFETLKRLFPRADWPVELQEETARRVARLPITAEQGKAALTNLRMHCKFQTIQPCEVLEALNRAAGPGESTGRTVTPSDRAVAAWLAQRDDVLIRLGNEWLGAQGWKFGHWSPYWLIELNEPCKAVWGVVFLRWAAPRIAEMEDGGEVVGK